MNCGAGNCKGRATTLNLTVDFGGAMVLRDTQKNSKDS
tara:strand:- start:143 stop:256 length:114 start_codon:yes stop_codon:yes gene_type:complete